MLTRNTHGTTAVTGARIEVDLSAIVHNWRTLSAHAAGSETAAVVKADAYGLGASVVAPALEAAGCNVFFVAELAEAVVLRPALRPETPVYVLSGLMPGMAGIYLEAGLRPVLNSLPQCRLWADAVRHHRPHQPVTAALQVDSGMSRFGLSVEEQEALLAEPGLLQALGLDLLMSHLANADVAGHPGNAAQLAAFSAASERFPGLRRSLSASAGMTLGQDYRFDLCRPGAALYGIRAGEPLAGLRAVARVLAPVLQLRSIPAGTSVGYGYSFRAERPTRLATIGIGYADGWSRSLSNAGCAFRDGLRLPIAGRISMDSFSVDITDTPEALWQEGDLVELIGPSQTIDEAAALAGSFGYEMMTGWGPRLTRVYV